MNPTDWLIELFGTRLPAAADSRRLRRLIAEGVVTWGTGAYGVPRVVTFRGCDSRLRVGPYASITSGATVLLGGNHPTGWVSLYPFRARLGLPGAYEDGMPSSKGDVTIGPDAWIGFEALILSGVRIGVGALVAARAVVVKDVPDYAIVAGNPATVLRHRFSEETRRRLLASRWWELPTEQLARLVPFLSSNDAEAFLARAEGRVAVPP